MYRVQAIKDGLFGLIGWRSDGDIDISLSSSESGLYYQQEHPLLTIDNLRSIAPQDVDFYAWLRQKTDDGIVLAIQRFVNEKLSNRTANRLLDSRILFSGAGRLSDTVTATNSMVGIEIVPRKSKGVTIKIDKIGLQFKGTGKIKLYLMHSSQVLPIKVIEIDKKVSGSMEWTPQQDLFLPYVSNYNDTGNWYLCYNQNELPEGMQAINKEKDWSTKPCGTCNSVDIEAWRAITTYMEIHPFRTPADEEIQMWDISDNIYTYKSNYGINLMVTAMCDVTDFIIDNRFAFQDIISKTVATTLLRELAYNANVRINRNVSNVQRNEVLYELDGDSSSYKKSGLMYQLEKAMKAISLDVTHIDKVCFPCNKKGISYKAI